MVRRDYDPESLTELTLRSPPNWTAILFLGVLGMLHLAIASHSFFNARWEGFLSLIFGAMFVVASVACWLVCSEISILREQSRIRLRTGLRSLRFERFIPFEQVQSIRLTLMNRRSIRDSRVEIVCQREVVECPPTDVPRQEALCLAMTMGVRLVKIYGPGMPDVSDRINKLMSA